MNLGGTLGRGPKIEDIFAKSAPVTAFWTSIIPIGGVQIYIP